MIAAQPKVDWRGPRDFGNVLRHRYDSLASSLLLHYVRNDLPPVLLALDAIENEIKR